MDTTNKITKQRILLHVLFWIIYYMFFVVFRYIYYAFVPKEISLNEILVHNLMFLPVDMSATYLTIYFLLPRFLYKRKYVLFILLFLITAVFFIFCEQAVSYFLIIPQYYPDYRDKMSFFVFDYVYFTIGTYSVVIFAMTVKLIKNQFEFLRMKNEMENRNLQSELALLRSQINPHFLFNTLNNIDQMIIKDQEKASDSLIKLSGIMRYMLYEANTDKVPMDRELDYIRSFVDLQMLRIRDQEFLSFRIEGSPVGKVIAPMLFVPYIENAFKHCSKNVPSPGIVILIRIVEKQIVLEVSNHIKSTVTAAEKNTGGIGLVNTKRRLDLIYSGKYELDIRLEHPMHIVKLKINL